MAQLKTAPSTSSVSAFVKAIPDEQRRAIGAAREADVQVGAAAAGVQERQGRQKSGDRA